MVLHVSAIPAHPSYHVRLQQRMTHTQTVAQDHDMPAIDYNIPLARPSYAAALTLIGKTYHLEQKPQGEEARQWARCTFIDQDLLKTGYYTHIVDVLLLPSPLTDVPRGALCVQCVKVTSDHVPPNIDVRILAHSYKREASDARQKCLTQHRKAHQQMTHNAGSQTKQERVGPK
jgi:hypothetical protein